MLANILPMISVSEELAIIDKEHQYAIKSYRLLKEVLEAEKINDLAQRTDCRKQLKAHAPDLYEVYFHRLM